MKNNPFMMQVDMRKGARRLGRWFGVPVLAHWSLLLFLPWLLITRLNLYFALVAGVSSLFIMIVHEFGHAFVARWRGMRVHEIGLLFLHGYCRHEAPYDEVDDVWVAWGGVLAQLLLAIVAFLLWHLLVLAHAELAYWLLPVYWALTTSNLMIAAFNLFPIPPLDGFRAWRVVPLLRAGWRQRSAQRRRRHLTLVKVKHYEESSRREVENIIKKMRQDGE